MDLVTRVLWGLLGAYTIAAVVFQLPQSDSAVIPALAAIVAFVSSGLIWIYRYPIGKTFRRLGEFPTSIPVWRWLVGCLAIGIALRVLCAAVFPSSYVSDTLMYWNLAQQLAAGEPYGSELSRSYWPPGLPLALTPFIVGFGPERWVPVLVNLLLFTGTSWCTLHLAQRTADHGAACVAVLLLTVWPNFVLLAAAPHKELLVAFLLPMAVLFYLRAFEKHAATMQQSRWSDFLGCGVCLGFAALAQPATALFGLVFVGLEAWVQAPLHRKATRLALVGSITILTVLPWTIRNYAVRDEFIPINTAGGINLYSANNPHATGGWIDDSLYVDNELQQADEITQNRLGYDRAFYWISQNKVQFVKLIIIKQTPFLCCDGHGAFLLFQHPKLTGDSDQTLGMIGTVASNAFWVMLGLFVLCGAILPSGFMGLRLPPLLLSLLGIWYFLAIFAVFQSEGKHHVNVAAFIAVVASCAVRSSDSARRTGGTSSRGGRGA